MAPLFNPFEEPVDKEEWEFKVESVEEVREWVSGQAPSALDRVTGRLLGVQVTHSSKSEIVSLLKEYDAAGAGDELTANFLRYEGAAGDVPLAIELGELIENLELRVAVLSSLGIGTEEVVGKEAQEEGSR